ncbi:hypothetical protein CBG25_13665 [Arsenophonus sp. ENCA]|uniref:EpsG family protein n=1 Tax=Arsenophonus sp. ENCA TaxID=1987579 RepID=UPI000BCB846A|nr:EpsG family protein [Arsenophonus sp. ENCA]PAV01976.1 hypothetical protein CBG25_13665 [Arsenophonus sp. ENCA]
MLMLNFNRLENVLYWCFAFLLALIIAILFSIQGGFDDSLVYYGQFIIVKKVGFYEAVYSIFSQTGKFEPGIILVFYIQSFFIDSLNSFLIVNICIINLLLASLYFIYNKSSHNNSRISYLSIAILFLSYYTFANYIYIWRSIYAFYFIGLYILFCKKNKYNFIFLVFAFFFHFSSLAYISIYFIIKNIKLSKLKVIGSSFIMSIMIFVMMFFLPEFITLFTSGDGQSVFITLDKEVYLIFRRILISSSFFLYY